MAGNNVFSMTQHGRSEPFDLQVARGIIPNHSSVNIYGFQASVSTTNIPVWENATAYTYPVSATKMHLVSTVNTGADLTATLIINGLDSGYNQISENITLNGTTVVTTVNSYLRINNMIVISGLPTGVITLKDLTDTTTYAQIAANFGRTQMALYTVPAGFTFYLARVDAYTSANGFTADYVQYRNQQTSSAGVISYTQQAPFINNYHALRVMPRAFAEKTDLQLQAKTSLNTYAVSIAAEGYLIANTAPSI